ncbi:MAG TPA: hypothetical protein EYN66_22225 [Myxococcales bacterium]|nr:hypothetical protein [Myxococcales bacterium]
MTTEVVSLANFCPNCGEALGSHSSSSTMDKPLITKRRVKKVKRKASAYARRYGAAFKRLKKKHPRTSFGKLSKKAHRLARRK